ncbi:Adenosylcobinamide-phosphate synthase [Saliniradius amylolyticus]|uniref:Adenosylcobinamide-phosphate synthase n=1 Tax=Saliniradius amylolyticus TaxID=2183582 RepID=A0A2S2E620_9ALTE|nr:cobalamin biosynthesis protein [Saliniradius amylolyticus]AWL12982.1 Adenosylcobinamide-phosphate synthase [Saliniradius amylolyticus]
MIEPIIDTPLLQRLLALWLVMLVESVWHWPAQYHPLLLFRALAQRMAAKVNPKGDRAQSQRLISGTLAPLVLLLPLAVCIGIFTSFAEYPVFFDALLLLAALDYTNTKRRARRVYQALQQNKKVLARDTAQRLLLRETQPLSVMGLSKAMIETSLLRYVTHYWTVLFVFLIGGGLAAFCFRVLAEFAQIWNTKLPHCRDFGRPVALLISTVTFIPARVAMFMIMLIQGTRPALKALRKLPQSKTPSLSLLAATGGSLGIVLGGPALYQGQKRRLPRCGGSRDPVPEDIPRLLRLLNYLSIGFLTLTLLLFAIVFALTTGRL